MLLVLLIYSYAVSAQYGPNFWTIFGNPSPSITPTGCNVNNQMSCTTPPASLTFSNVIPLYDLYTGISTAYGVDMFKNSIYDKSGELLFSVNADGIYAPDALGTQAILI